MAPNPTHSGRSREVLLGSSGFRDTDGTVKGGEERVDVVVVGAGLAGVVAARLLMRAGIDVLVIEGRERVGGRLLTCASEVGLAVDLGGQWIGPGQHRMEALVQELGIPTHPTHHGEKVCFELDGTCGSSRVGFPLSRPFALLGLILGMGRVEKEAKRALRNPPWAQGALGEASDVSVGAFIQNRVWPEAARSVLRGAFEGIFCRNPDEVSMNLALYAIGASGGFAHMQGVKGGAQERQLSVGAGGLVERLAGELGDRVRLGVAVRRIERASGGVIVRCDASSARARQVIVAIPPPLVARLDFDPPLPTARWEAIKAARMGLAIKHIIVYREPFWRKQGKSGAIWSNRGPVSFCYDTTPAPSEYGVLSALSVAENAKAAAALSPEERRSKVLEMLSRHFGPEAKTPLEYFDLVWSQEPFSLGGYSVTLPVGGFAWGPSLFGEAVPPIHFAGTETASEYPGYMEGAVQSGERVAQDVLRELGRT